MARPSLLSRLASADRSWRRSLATESLLRSLVWLVLGVAGLVAADLIAQLGSTTRCVLACLGGAIVLGWLVWLAVRAFGPSGPLLRIARHLESRNPDLGTKLVNSLQLESQSRDPGVPELTRTLAHRALEEAAHDLQGQKFLPLTKSPTLKRTALRSLVPVALLLVPALVFAPLAGRELLRFLDPFGDHPPFSLTRLNILSPDRDGVGVVYKKPVTIEVEWTGHRPAEVFLSVVDPAAPEKETLLPMAPAGNRRFVQQIDQVTSDLVVRALTKNGRSLSQARHLRAILTPQLEKAQVLITPPAYTKRPAHEAAVPLGGATAPSLTALAGSELAFTLTSNRPLSTSRMELRTTAPSPVPLTLQAGTGDQAHLATASLAAAESGRLRFDLRDVNGLPADRELAANLTVTHDLPPEVAITEPTNDGFIVDSYKATIALRASDDYGLKSLRWHIGLNGTFARPETKSLAEDPPQRTAVETWQLSPAALGAHAGDVITIFAEAVDIRPDPQIARSQTLTLEVITEADYNEHLRLQSEIGDLEAKYAALHQEMRRLAEEQRALAAEAAALKDPTAAQRDTMKAKQDDLNARLEALAQKMATTTRDQPLYDLEKDLQKVLDEQAEAVRASVAENQKSLDAFAQADPGASSLQAFAEAAKAQADRLDPAAAAGEKRIAEALQDAQLMQDLLKSLGAFQALYQQQQQLAAQTAAYRSDTPPSDEDRLALQQMAGSQRDVSEGLQAIVNALRRDADSAQEAYPEAAEDARAIAQAIEQAGLPALASTSARAMLAARGPESHDRAEQVRAEMEKLMSQCGQCQGSMSESFAQRLKLMRSMLAGQTFSQMAQCRKFGIGRSPGGSGTGTGGFFGIGQAQDGTPQRSLLGGESHLGRRPGRESATKSDGQGEGMTADAAEAGTPSATDGRSGPAAHNRPATSATGDAVLDEYREVVDAYFRKLTTSRPTPP